MAGSRVPIVGGLPSVALLAMGLLTCTDRSRSDASSPLRLSRSPEGFWEVWSDGKAELNGYAVTQRRYGDPRPGEAVLIFVTETMRHDVRAKTNTETADSFPVMKLNAVLDFQTGIYDYNIMTSTFIPLSGETPRGIATKSTFSMQEWCGNTHAEIRADHEFGDPVSGMSFRTSHYFDESPVEDTSLPLPANAVMADALPVLVRGLAGSFVAPGETMDVALLPRLVDAHMQQTAVGWRPGELSRGLKSTLTEVPAGRFATHNFSVTQQGVVSHTFHVEAAPPHRLIAWEGADGERGELTGSIRAEYWNQNRAEHTTLRNRIGLEAPAWPRSYSAEGPTTRPER